VIAQLDRTLDAAVDGEVLVADDPTFDAQRLSNPRGNPTLGKRRQVSRGPG